MLLLPIVELVAQPELERGEPLASLGHREGARGVVGDLPVEDRGEQLPEHLFHGDDE